MKAVSRQCEPLGLHWRLLIGLALLGSTPHGLLARDDHPKGLPPHVERVLRWLPEDTETLFVARFVTLPEPNPAGPEKVQWQDIGVGLATGDLDLVDGGKHSKPLRGRKIECIVSGARNFESVSSFGSLRSEMCTIIVFERDLGDAAREWTESLRKGAKAVRTLVGREVFVFPSMTVMESGKAEWMWQGTYFVLLTPNTVLCASSDRYLESVVRRVNGVPEARALPDNLPEWKQVDFDAPVWMLRHIPKLGERSHSVGLTARFMRNGFRVVYIPKIGSDLNIEKIREEWLAKGLLDSQILRDRLNTVRQPQGTVILSYGEKFSEDTLLFGFQLYWLQAFGLFHADE